MRRITRWLAGIGASSLLVLTSATPAVAAPKPLNAQWWFKAWEIQKKVWPISKGSGVTVAVIDSGVNANLPGLKNAVLPGTNLETQGGGNGFIPPTSDLMKSHGTSMAALIAAQGAGTGYLGVAPEAKVISIRANLLNWDKAIRFAVDQGAKVINFSQGYAHPQQQCRPKVQKAVAYAIEHDVVVVAASGNSGDGANRPEGPANCEGVLAVGAVDSQKRAWFATQQQPYVDVAAPGASMVALLANGQLSERVAGTSGATALASAAVAIVRSKFPQMSGREVVQRILHTVKDAGPPGKDNLTGQGVIIPVAALTAQVPESAPNQVYAGYDKWKQANPQAVESAKPGQNEQSGGAAPKANAADTEEEGSAQTLLIALVVGVVVIVVVVLVLFLFMRKGKKKAAPMGPGPGPGFGPPGGPQGPPPGWGGQQAGPPAPYGPQGGQQYMPPPQQGGMPQQPVPPQQGGPQGAPPPQGPGGPYPPR